QNQTEYPVHAPPGRMKSGVLSPAFINENELQLRETPFRFRRVRRLRHDVAIAPLEPATQHGGRSAVWSRCGRGGPRARQPVPAPGRGAAPRPGAALRPSGLKRPAVRRLGPVSFCFAPDQRIDRRRLSALALMLAAGTALAAGTVPHQAAAADAASPAQEVQLAAGRAPIELDPVTVLGTRTEKAASEVLASIGVVGQEEIKIRQADDLGDLVDDMPG